jgi:outer membrane protein TolC
MKRTIIGIATMLCASMSLFAADELSIYQAVEQARASNPEVLAARRTFEGATARVSQAGAWPDPQVGVEFMGVRRSSLDLNTAPERWYDVAQTIPFPGKQTLRAKAAHHGAAREDENYRTVVRDVATKVKVAYYGLLYSRRSADAAQQSTIELDRLAKTAESEYGAGRISQAEALRARIELAKSQHVVLEMAQKAETSLARLNSLLNRPPDTPAVPIDEPKLAPLDYDRDRLEGLALVNRPEVLAASHHVSHAQGELAAARAEYLPDTMVQYSWREFENGQKDSVAMFKFNLPFVWFKRQMAVVDAARSERAHAEAMVADARNTAVYDVREAYSRALTTRRLAELYRDVIVPESEQAARVAEAGYRAGRTPFRDYLDAEREALGFRMENFKALQDYGTALAALERAVGIDLFIEKPEERHE